MPRLDILLARNLGMSRSAVTRLLRGKHVQDADGRRLDDGRVQIAPSDLPTDVLVAGQTHTLRHRVDLIQHKPTGVVTALRDAKHPTAAQLLHDAPLHRDLRAVGRLDLDTSGLLLWTTDGTLLHKLTHPRYGLTRTYHAALAGPFVQSNESVILSDGHRPEITGLHEIAPHQAHPGLAHPPGTRNLASITIVGGKFHEVRRIFVELGTVVLGLCRVEFGDIALPQDLAAGTWRLVDLQAQFRGLAPRATDSPAPIDAE